MTTTIAATKYLSTADKCRAALKAAGIKANQVTVKCPHGGTVYVTIRTTDVSILKVESIVQEFIVTRRCERTDEILSGGTSIYVKYAPEVLAPLCAEITAIIMATPARRGVDVGPHHVHWEPNLNATTTPDHMSLVHTSADLVIGSKMSMRAYGLDNAANQLATDLLARGIKTLVAAVQS